MPSSDEGLMKQFVDHPKLVAWTMVLVTVGFVWIAALPSFWPGTFPFLHPIQIDTDPENMLPKDEGTRVFHNRMKRTFNLHEMIVLGVVNESHPEGVFNPESLGKIFWLTEFAKTLRWPDPNHPDRDIGVIEVDILSPSTVDNIEQGGLGVVRFEWLMSQPPKTDTEAIAIRRAAERIPFLKGTLLSEDGRAVALYFPITSKDLSYKVATQLKEKISTFKGDERYFITGLPVAEDTFGVEMFKQMAISAPIAMAVVFLLMFFFFRKLVIIIPPMIVAMVSVISTMGLLVATGNTIHIMSSMIPIFIMPIAVLDAIHILSEFFDRYQETKDRRATILKVMKTLFKPMLFTTLTTATGFASLAFTPIPPVQVFGLFVAFGVLAAWVWTISFIPASIMLIRRERLENFGVAAQMEENSNKWSLARLLTGSSRITYRYAKPLLGVTVLLTLVAVYGIFQISINDNPIKWFESSHPIRVSDRVLNEHFGGTYMANLAFEAEEEEEDPKRYAEGLAERLITQAKEEKENFPSFGKISRTIGVEVKRLAPNVQSKEKLLGQLETFSESSMAKAPDDEFDAWDEILLFIDQERQRGQTFKQPEVLNYISKIQDFLLTTGVVGKSNSLADIVKTVHRELFLGEEEAYKIPKSANGVAQTLMTYQNSHRPQDLWHFVTPDYRTTNIWFQLKSGDNRDMARVVQALDRFVDENPSPLPLQQRWFGLTYINVIWQEKMVSGMLRAFLGSFVIVFIMMTVLFRSFLWGILSMVPLTVTIGLIYGVIGLIGKDYDMPVAVLSSLSLGLSIDYAIHFLARSRMLQKEKGPWAKTITSVFGDPARAITRNVIVVGLGFLPLLAAPLVPYQTVGIFIAAILLTAGVATLLILPALITLLEPWLFPGKKG